MRAHELSLEEFDRLRDQVRRRVNGIAQVEESEVPDGFPHPKTSVCAALAKNSVVVGADGLTYRCGLKWVKPGARLDRSPITRTYILTRTWMPHGGALDPTSLASCSQCSFLPICWGGCPKKHLEGDDHAILEQGRYWRSNLPLLIAKAAGFAGILNPVIPESQQFRSSP
jgi:uncharacterized protein